MSKPRFFERHAGLWAFIAGVGNVGAVLCALFPGRLWVGRGFALALMAGLTAFFLAWVQSRRRP